MSEHVWYFLKESFAGESQEGPLTEPQFVQLVKKGQLKKQTKICSPSRTKGQWTTVEKVPSIFNLIEQGKQERAQEKAAKSMPVQDTSLPTNPAIGSAMPQMIPPGAPNLPMAMGPPNVTGTPTASASPFAAPSTSVLKASGFKPRVYPWLSIIRHTCYVLAGLATVSMLITLVGSIISIVGLIAQEFYDLFWVSLFAMGVSAFSHVLVIMFLVFLANLIKLLIDVQSNTELTAFNTSQLASRQ